MLLRECRVADRVRLQFGTSRLSCEVQRVSDSSVAVYAIDLGHGLILPGETECERVFAEGSHQGNERYHPGGIAIHPDTPAPDATAGGGESQASPSPADGDSAGDAPTPVPSPAGGADHWALDSPERHALIEAGVAKIVARVLEVYRSLGMPDPERVIGEAFVRCGHRTMQIFHDRGGWTDRWRASR